MPYENGAVRLWTVPERVCQMDRELDRLRDEITRLRDEVRHDGLTKLYNRTGCEAAVAEALQKPGSGLFVLMDIDRFKQLNARSGHSMGDMLLHETARLLEELFSPRDIVARVDGDVFAIYATGGCTREMAYARVAQVASRLRSGGHAGPRWNVSFTLGITEKKENDDYAALFDRAERLLHANKAERHGHRVPRADDGDERGICTDMDRIHRELHERNQKRGAFCQDYETFKQIYRFVERGLKRSGYSAYTILMTLTDTKGSFLPLPVRSAYMEQLGEDLRVSLRTGDLFTQYSSGQYLLMVLGASGENAAVITTRITNRFTERLAPDSGIVLRFDLHPVGDEPSDAEE